MWCAGHGAQLQLEGDEAEGRDRPRAAQPGPGLAGERRVDVAGVGEQGERRRHGRGRAT